ncbi:putative RNA-directed DNA polymerase [Tanacetum coccineum]|uniref:RNA-directed DNA polymerase n=1 Tax=Tanacetum coccineum TaxID=301880 RepID=A0ABQ4Z3M1_9ASTR
MVKCVILLCLLGFLILLSPDLYAGAIYAKSAYELWNDPKETYDKVDGFAVFNLHKNINSLTQSGYSLAEYYNNLNSLWKQFDAMISLPACTCEVAEHYEKHNQLIKLMQFLMGLDDNYLAIRSNILTREPLPLVKAAFAIVSDICDRCFEIIGYPAGYVKKNFIPNSRPVTSNNTTVDPQSNNVNSNATSKSPVSLSNEQLTRLMNLLNENGVFSTNANMSGANQHMTVSAKILINVVDISNLGLIVGHLSGTRALITKIRDLKLNNKITLYNVLVVPEYTVSLLSVHKLSRDNKLFVGFNENNCYIQDLKANKTLGIGRQFNGLYLFDVDNACKVVSNCSISTCFVSRTLWHERLGHPADPVLDVLKSSLNLDSETISEHLCDTCNKDKQTREPFPLSDHKSSKIGELVHLDVWGPYKVTSIDGFSYFFTIVDDFTSAVWIYMLKGKDDVYDSILSFAQMINNQFETNVKTFRSDNGSEFVNNKLQRFFNEKDPKRPNDGGRVSFNDDGSELSPDNNNQGNDDSDATSMEETNNTHLEGNSQNEIDFINEFDDSKINSDIEEFPVNNLRRVVNYANIKPDSFYFVTALNKSIEPSCYEEVVLDSNWIDAMNSEIEALNDNQTWVITDLPPGIKAIGNKWIHKIKYKSSGDIDRYKARLVVKGCSKKEGVDFDETFSPVVKMSTVRCLIALSVTNNWPLF